MKKVNFKNYKKRSRRRFDIASRHYEVKRSCWICIAGKVIYYHCLHDGWEFQSDKTRLSVTKKKHLVPIKPDWWPDDFDESIVDLLVRFYRL